MQSSDRILKSIDDVKTEKNGTQPWEGSTEIFNCRVLAQIPKL